VGFEQIDQTVGRWIVILARLLRGLGPHPLRDLAARERRAREPFEAARRFRFRVPLDRAPCRPPQFVRARDEAIDVAGGARGCRAQHPPGQHVLHRGESACLSDRAGRTVETWKDAKLDLGETDPRRVIARRDPVVAGQRELKPATDARAMERDDHKHLHCLDPVEQRKHRLDCILDLGFGIESVELVDVGADDERLRFAAENGEPGNRAIRRARLDRFDNLAKFFERSPAECIRALAGAIERCPGNFLEVDLEVPILELQRLDRLPGALCGRRHRVGRLLVSIVHQ
jgi:hypothetical protein